MLRSVEHTIHLADDFEERAQPFDELSLSGVFLSNASRRFSNASVFPCDAARSRKSRRRAVARS